MNRHIIAIGGGGFSDDSEPDLDAYILEQSSADEPRIGFIGTASGDSESYLLKYYKRFSELNCVPSHLPFFRRSPDINDWIRSQDVIFVGGGNTMSMLAVWKSRNLPELLRSASANGTVIAGISAGAICWFEFGLTDSLSGTLAPMECLGFLPGSCCPHYSREEERKPNFERYIRDGQMPDGIAIDDGAAVHFVDGKPYRVVSGRSGAVAYHVAKTADGVASTQLSDIDTVTYAV